jgi:acetyl esterase/lipase
MENGNRRRHNSIGGLCRKIAEYQIVLKAALILLIFCSAAGIISSEAITDKKAASVKTSTKMYSRLYIENYIRDISQHPAFEGFGNLLLPYDDNSAYLDTRLNRIGSLMPYHGNVHPAIILDSVNHLIDEVNKGNTIFYSFYTDAQKKNDPDKKNTGLFFYRGKPNAPFAIVCPGGGFSYVGSLHEGFPIAWEISKKGLNAFVIRYRIGSEQKATEDLAAALTYLFMNSKNLAVNIKDYSIWGGSAGARMAGNIALTGVPSYGGGNIPKPASVIIAYTGQSSFSSNFPPTFITISADDPIANITVVERRVTNLRNSGIDVEYQKYLHAGHGFGLGAGTDAEGWLALAVRFWEKHISH